MIPAAEDPPFFAAVDQVAGAGIQANSPRLGQSTLATWDYCSRGARVPRIAYSAASWRNVGVGWSGVMIKSFAIAAAAALSGPIIGVAVFFAANSDHSNREGTSLTVAGPWTAPKTASVQPDFIRTFAPQGLRLDPASIVVQERKPQTATIRTLAEPLAWLTVVTCAEGQPLLKNGRCPAPKSVSAPSTDMGAIADGTPTADSVGSRGIEIPERAPFSPGRMSLGAP